MWQYVFLQLRRQPGKSALVSSGFLLAACALILLSATTQTTLVRGNQIISQNWRPTYDLVVLPAQAKIPADPRVPSDLLAGYGGGISVQQYQQIRSLPGIEVAAPIAYVGYVQMPVPVVYLSDHSLSSGYYHTQPRPLTHSHLDCRCEPLPVCLAAGGDVEWSACAPPGATRDITG